jgi:purine-nucleoside phosphorylase
VYRDWPPERLLSSLGLTTQDVPEAVLLMGAWSIPESVKIARCYFDNINSTEHFWNGFLGKTNDICVGYAGVFGASMAASIAHIFAAAGTKFLIQLGSCGSLQPGFHVGDLIIPDIAVKGDGVSQAYGRSQSVCADSELSSILSTYCLNSGKLARQGVVYSTTTLYTETQRDIRTWQQKGYNAVDMETAVTFSVAKAFGCRCAALLYVIDRLAEGFDLADLTEEELRRETVAEQLLLDVSLKAVIELLGYARF